jgi:hypothetical protein
MFMLVIAALAIGPALPYRQPVDGEAATAPKSGRNTVLTGLQAVNC